MTAPLYSDANGQIDTSTTDTITCDFGITYHGYASDVSRVYGLKTEAHRELYDSLYHVHSSLIDIIVEGRKREAGKKGEITINAIHAMFQTLMLNELKKLGFGDGSFEKMSTIFQRICPLYIGHFMRS